MLLLLTITATFAESISVTGSIIDKDGQPMIGSTVVENQNPTNGSVSDLDGNFKITAPKGSTLTVSMIGYESEQIVVGSTTTPISIVMRDTALDLDEVVVIGYGAMKRSDITGSVSTIKGEDLMTANTPSLGEALQGRIPGLDVTTTSSAPGGSVSIRIRGVNSLLSDADPLYVVDGFAVDDISSINVNDIESVEVLKDASSTAIYGSRGANGVILIQTKQGVASKPVVTFNVSVGVQQIYRKVDLLNGEQFAELYNEYCINNGEEAYFDGSSRDRMLPEDIGEGTDWYDQIMQIGMIQSYDFSASGGSERVKYRIAGGYYGNKGVVIGGNYSSIRFNASNTIKLAKWLDLRTNINLTRNTTDGSGDRTGLETSSGTLNNALKMSPTINVYDEDGNYNSNNLPAAQSNENPVAYANEVLDNTRVDVVSANVNFTLTPLKDLTINIKAGANIKKSTYRYYLSDETIEGAKIDGQATLTEQDYQTLVNEYIANYKREFGKHKLYATAAFSLETYQTEKISITGTGMSIDDLSYAGIASAETISQPTFAKYSSSLVSGLGRLNYNYDNRYLFTLTARADGNSRFAEGHKWGLFPSAAFAWRANNEKFLKSVEQINDLKLRLSYGVTGNSKIGYYRSLGLLTNTLYSDGSSLESGVTTSTIANSDLTWESTAMYNVGVDLSMFKNRLTLSVDAYYKLTTNMLMSYDLPNTSGFSTAYVNAGELENKGMELALSGVVYRSKDWDVSLGGSIAFNRDKVLELYDGGPLTIDLGDNQTLWISEGSPIRQFTGYEVAGIFSSDEEVASYTWTDPETGKTSQIQPNAEAGDIKYVDQNGDGEIDSDDQIVYGSAMPKFTYGITAKASWRNLTLNLFVNGSYGNWVYNRNMAYLTNTTTIRNNLSATLLDRWTPDNIDATMPRLGSDDSLPNYEDASYIRIQNIALSYTFPRKMIKWISKLTVTAGIDNLYVWTEYSGWDPDVNSAYGGSENVNIGTDVNSCPKARVYRFSLSATF